MAYAFDMFEDMRKRRAAMTRRLRRDPAALRFWCHGLADTAKRDCLYCGLGFAPDMARPIDVLGAPLSVVEYHRRAFCSVPCARGGGFWPWDGRAERIRRTAIEAIKPRAIFERDGWRCYLCGCACSIRTVGVVNPCNEATLDHIVPLSRHGTHRADNVATACRDCNRDKGNATLGDKLALCLDTGALPDSLAEMVALWRTHVRPGHGASGKAQAMVPCSMLGQIPAGTKAAPLA